MTNEFKQNIEKAEEWLSNISEALPKLKHNVLARERIKLLKWLIEQAKANNKA